MDNPYFQKKGDQSYKTLVSYIINDLDLADEIRSAKRILIKPNLVAAKTSDQGVTVDLNLIGELVRKIRSLTDAPIIVGEHSLIGTNQVFEFLKLHELEKFGCNVQNFEESNWCDVAPPFSLLFNRMLVPEPAIESDLIFNISKMKTHTLTGVSLGLKNCFGLLSSGGRKTAHKKDINKGIVDVFSYFEMNKTMVSVIDGLVALSGPNGPINGIPVNADVLIYGRNSLLCDVFAAESMGMPIKNIEHVRLAAQVLDVDISQSPSPLDIHGLFALPVMTESGTKLSDWLAENLFYKYPVIEDKELCRACKRCERICPCGIATIKDNKFSYDPTECIHCLCCVEACNTGALSYKIKFESAYHVLKKIRDCIKRQ